MRLCEEGEWHIMVSEACESVNYGLSRKDEQNIHVIQDRPTHLSHIILEYQVQNLEIVDHMVIRQINLCRALEQTVS